MQGSSLFRDYKVNQRGLGKAFKVSLPAKASLLETIHTTGLSFLQFPCNLPLSM